MFSSDRYKRGAHTVLELQYHFVWKTKYGYPILRGDVGLRLRELLRQICSEKDIAVIRPSMRIDQTGGHLKIR